MVTQVGLNGTKRLDDDVINIIPQLLHIMAILFEFIEYDLDAALMTHIHILLILIEHKIGIILIDSIISKMHTHILEVGVGGSHVRLCSESHQSILVHVDTHWVATSQQHIYSQVKLQAIYEERFVHVPLSHIMISRVYTVN